MPTDLYASIPTCSPEEFRAILARTDPRLHPALFTERARHDPAFFMRQALGAHLRHPFASFHRLLFEWHRGMGEGTLPTRRGRRHVVAAPRGAAKSTVVSFGLVLHDIAFARERYMALVSATQRQAQQRLSALRGELTRRTSIVRWFRPAFDRGRVVCSARAIEANGVRIEAFGAGSEMRGISHDGWRPTKIILDDAESSAAAESPRRRQRLLDWFGEVIEHLGDTYTHWLVVGTVLHPAGLLSRLLVRPDVASVRLRSVMQWPDPGPLWDQWRALLTDASRADARDRARAFFIENREAMTRGSEVLWPHKEDIEDLMAQMLLQGRHAFWQEKQNEPLGPEDALFDPARVWRARATPDGIVVFAPGGEGDMAPAMRTYPHGDLRRFGYLDAALGKGAARGAGDFAALATVALAPDGTLILERLWVRRASPTAQVHVVFDSHAERAFERLALEGTGFQELLSMPMEEERARRRAASRPWDVPLEIVRPTRRKEARIAALEPLLASGRLALAEDLPEEFREELARFPRSDHDDALDATAGAVELALRRAGEKGGITVGRLGERARASPF